MRSYIYKKLRPFRKFLVPVTPPHAEEKNAWTDLAQGTASADAAHKILSDCRDRALPLSARSHRFLSLQADDRLEFVDEYKARAFESRSCITCLCALNVSRPEADAASTMVLGLECDAVLVLKAECKELDLMVALPSTPAFVCCIGLRQVEYRIFVACRNSTVYCIKNGERTATTMELSGAPVGMCLLSKLCVVGCNNCCVQLFSFRGKCSSSIYMKGSVQAVAAVPQSGIAEVTCWAVALAGQAQELRVYNESTLLNTVLLKDNPSGMVFGRFGREDSTVIVTHRGGSLAIKIMSRQSNLSKSAAVTGPPLEQDMPLDIPKKSKLCVEQNERERLNARAMHQAFQQALCRLRLATGRSFVKTLSSGFGPVSSAPGSCVKLQASLQGLGPVFRVRVTVKNSGAAVADAMVVITCDAGTHAVNDPIFKLGLLAPAGVYSKHIYISCHEPEKNLSGFAKIVVSTAASSTPLACIIVSIPAPAADF